MPLTLLSLADGIPAWSWLILAAILGAGEAGTGRTFLLFPAIAALFTGASGLLIPELGLTGQFWIFTLLTLALLVVGRTLGGRFGPARRTGTSPNLLIGREAVVNSFEYHEGQVSIDGESWPARLMSGRTPKPGDKVAIIAADGIVVWVKPV